MSDISDLTIAKKIRNLILLDKLDEAAVLLKETCFRDEGIKISRRLIELKRKTLDGQITNDYATTEKNQIATALLEYAQIIERPVIVDSITSKKNLKNPQKFAIVGLVTLLVILLLGKFFFEGNETVNKYPPSTHSLTVLVHGIKGKDQLVLPNRGIVYLIYGDSKIPEKTNDEGEATFKQIPLNFFNDNNGVEILFKDPEGEPYQSVNADSIYQITPGQYLSLIVSLNGLGAVQGIVKDFNNGNFVEGAVINIMGERTLSNRDGYFLLQLPLEKQKKFHTLRVHKKGYKQYTKSNLLVDETEEISIMLKPL